MTYARSYRRVRIRAVELIMTAAYIAAWIFFGVLILLFEEGSRPAASAKAASEVGIYTRPVGNPAASRDLEHHSQAQSTCRGPAGLALTFGEKRVNDMMLSGPNRRKVRAGSQGHRRGVPKAT